MEARFRDGDGVMVVELIGRLDYRTVDPFRMNCIEKFGNKRVIFNLRGLSFVGSSGISSFLDAMKILFKVNGNSIKFCEVGSEFKRIFAASAVRDIEIFENETMAIDAFMRPVATEYSWNQPQAESEAPVAMPVAVTEGSEDPTCD